MPDQHSNLALPAVVTALQSLVTSAEPAVVFTDLVRVCVPALCDACTVWISEDHLAGYRITNPAQTSTACDDGHRSAPEHRAGDQPAVQIPIRGLHQDPAYRGMLTCYWQNGRRPSAAQLALAQLAVDRAVHAVQHERLIESLTCAEANAAHLQTALASSREIGVAIGIVMSRYLVTRDDAVNLLRFTSQRAQRKLRDIAAEVADAGELPALEGGRPSPEPRRGAKPHALTGPGAR